jgi:hypothetical protein
VNASATATPYCTLAGGPDGPTCTANGSWLDSDGDGLSDVAEAQGYIDVNANGVYDPGIDIPLTGADPNKPDVFLHYDYTVASDHSHNPPAQAIQWIVDAFAAHGVNLHIDPQHNAICENAGDSGCITVGTGAQVVTLGAPGTGFTDPACAGPSAVSIHELRDAIPYLALIKPAYHYMVFAHYASVPSGGGPWICPTDPETPACGSLVSQPPAPGNSGTSEIGGDDSIVATQPFVDSGAVPDLSSIPLEWLGGLGMHEFGHNLGLLHGGSDCFNNKPNYVSVMNYRFYVAGIPVGASPGDSVTKSCSTDSDCYTGDQPSATQHCSTLTHACLRIDYSDRLFNDLDENNLDETVGLQGGATNTDISWWHAVTPTAFVHIPTNGTPIDWNLDGTITSGVAAEVNGDGTRTLLSTQNDWSTVSVNGVNQFANLKFKYQCDPNYGDDLITPRDLRFGKEEPMVAAARLSVERLLQRSWREALRTQPPGSWAARTSVQVVGRSGQPSERSAPAADWLKERPLWPAR